MKLQQIPVVHSLVMRWRHLDADKAASTTSVDPTTATPEKRPAPTTTPPSPKSPSKKSVQISEGDNVTRRVQISEGDIIHKHERVDKGKGRKTENAAAPAVPTALPSPPPSPRISFRPRPADRCSSGTPTSHPEIGEISGRYGTVIINETFECTDAVDPVRLFVYL
jgi:hypothetical protein